MRRMVNRLMLAGVAGAIGAGTMFGQLKPDSTNYVMPVPTGGVTSGGTPTVIIDDNVIRKGYAPGANGNDSIALYGTLPIGLRQNDPVAVAPAGPVVKLSREECIDIALQDNPTIKVANLEIQRYNYAKRETQGGLFPTIDFSGVYQRTLELQTIRMNMGGVSQSLKMGSENTWNLGFSASMPIIAPSLWKAIQINEVQIMSSLEAARSSKLDLVNQVNQAYYAYLLAIASKKVLQENYEVTAITADIYQKQFDAGTASEFDVLRSSVALKNLEPELLQADIAVKQCQLQLKVLMGMDANVEVEPNVELKDMQQDMYAYPLESGRSIADNSSLRTLDIQRKLLDKTVQLNKMAWVPTLAASFNYSWTSLSNGNPFKNQQFNPYSTVGLALSVPIFSGGSKYHALKQTEVQLKELELQREYLVNSLNMQVELALDNINREAQQIASNEEGMKQAKKAHEIMQKSFEIGAASYLDLRDSELADTAAQLAYYQAIYNFLVSTSELDLLLGKEKYLNNATR